MNKFDGQRRHIYFRRKITLFCIAVFLFGVLFRAFPLAGPVELLLNTIVPAGNIFEITEPSPIGLTLGGSRSVGYTYTGNSQLYLTITSANPSTTNQMRMKEIGSNYYIPYTMTFDYDGAGPGAQTAVYHGFKKMMGGYDNNNGYNLVGTFVITTQSSDNYLEGDYADTITFAFTAN
ncbi:MAG: hypothetical protein PHR10_10370 [Sphaerochaetaceae bacterium]|nr:hypothetical protein [Sphaerochaetaceae bacterium]